ncbi:MAG: hypothetical protein HC897_00820 [Thermoanaerobaculia bacterium]|nr:hypothetical protein [Thermoanaerobaculia bacterium]
MNGEHKRKGSSTCLSWGIGCLVVGLIGIGILIALGAVGVGKLRQYAQNMEDPAIRTQRASELLGASTLPEGYKVVVYLDVPMLAELVILSTSEKRTETASGEPVLLANQRMFHFFSLRAGSDKREELRRYIEGEVESASFFENFKLHTRSEQLLGRGAFELPGQQLSWAAHRGTITTESRRELKGLYTLISTECRDDPSRARLGVWFERFSDAVPPPAGLDVAGTPADPAAIEAFMAHFAPCPHSPP